MFISSKNLNTCTKSELSFVKENYQMLVGSQSGFKLLFVRLVEKGKKSHNHWSPEQTSTEQW